jgi:uncharacterized protein
MRAIMESAPAGPDLRHPSVPGATAPALRALEQRLRAVVRGAGSAAIAFSGGVDSALVLKIAHDELGARAVAVTGRSASFAPEEMADAERVCREIGVRQILIETEEITLRGYRDNGPERCFACKSELYTKMADVCASEGLATMIDGVNVDDAESGERPGIEAAEQRGVLSPLLVAGLRKADVRALAAHLGLSVAEKPAMACLSSRIPFGERITEEKLEQVAAAESALRKLGFAGGRVRHHDSVARIELPTNRLQEALEPTTRAAIVAGVRAAGFAYVTLDLEGYRTGSMHEVLSIRPYVRGPGPLAILLAGLLGAVAATGCTVQTVKKTDRRVLTAEESAARSAKGDGGEGEGDATRTAATPGPRSLAEQIEEYRASSEKEPQNPRWHFLLGRAYEQDRKLELAELRYRKGKDLIQNPDQYTGPHFLLGRVLAKQEKWDQAMAELTKAVAVKPSDEEQYYLNEHYRESFFLIGVGEYHRKNTRAAESAFQQFLKFGGERDRVIPFFPKMVAE